MTLAAAVRAHAQGLPVVNRLERVGAGLYEVVVGESTDALYVASADPGQQRIFVLDPRTLIARSSLDTAKSPAFGLAFNNRTRTLYTTNTRSNTVAAIDVRSGAVIATIGAPDGGVAHVFRALVDEDANTVYVSVPETSSRVWVIDGATNELRHEIVNTGGRSTGLAIDRARNRLYTCSIASSEILEIDLAARRVSRRFASGGLGTTHLEYDAATDRLFAGHQRSGDVTVLSPKAGAVLKTIPTGAGALGLAFDRQRNLLYVANREAGTVSVIDAKTLAVTTTLRAGTMPNSVAIDSRSGNAYVTFKGRPAGRGETGSLDPGADTVARIVVGGSAR